MMETGAVGMTLGGREDGKSDLGIIFLEMKVESKDSEIMGKDVI